jgi:single-stranded DNA-binding protein
VKVRLQALPRAAKEGRVQQRAWEGRGKLEGRRQQKEARRQLREGRMQLLEGRMQLLEGRRQQQEGRRQASIHQLRQIDCPNKNVFSFFPMGLFWP